MWQYTSIVTTNVYLHDKEKPLLSWQRKRIRNHVVSNYFGMILPKAIHFNVYQIAQSIFIIDIIVCRKYAIKFHAYVGYISNTINVSACY